jgi:hypothetical protein
MVLLSYVDAEPAASPPTPAAADRGHMKSSRERCHRRAWVSFALIVATGFTIAGCATPPPAKPAPAGRGWRTYHQGYVATRVTSSTSRQGSSNVTTTHSNSEQIIFANEAGPSERPRLVRGATVTQARLAGGTR